MTQYLISFNDGDMTFPVEDLPDVAKAARAVARGAGRRRVRVRGWGAPGTPAKPASWPLTGRLPRARMQRPGISSVVSPLSTYRLGRRCSIGPQRSQSLADVPKKFASSFQRRPVEAQAATPESVAYDA